VHIEIDGGDTIDTIDGEKGPGSEGSIGKEAKAHGAVGRCMVTGRADGAEGTPCLAAGDAAGGFPTGPRCKQGSLHRMRSVVRVGIQPTVSNTLQGDNPIKVRGGVNGQELLASRLGRGDTREFF
jgi:hypothetical protein